MPISNFYDYEKTISRDKKVSLGIVYTPIEIVRHINKRSLDLWQKAEPPKVLDPCAGTGIFLYDMAEQISLRWDMPLEEVYRQCIFGNDLDDDAVSISKDLMPFANLSVGDGLKLNFAEYDVIVTNPPYIRIQNLDPDQRTELKNNYISCKGDTDIYVAFFEKMIKSGVICGFICPNSWRKNKGCSSLRTLMEDSQRADTIIDFKSKKVFKNIDTYTSIVIFDSKKTQTVHTGTDIDKITVTKQESVFSNGCVLIDADEQALVSDILKRDRSIFDICDIKVGLATLCDSVFFLELIEHRGQTSYVKQKTKNSAPFEIESSVLVKCIKGSDITKNLDKQYVVIYPYNKEGKEIKEAKLKEQYPLAFSYLEKHKERLLKRDKGKKKAYSWYGYGRTQALNLTTVNKLVFSPMVKDQMVFKDSNPQTTFISGYCIVPKQGHTLEELKKVFSSDEVKSWIKIFGKSMGSNWLGISKSTFSKYKIQNHH